MELSLYSLIEPLTQLPFNLWFWLLWLAAPVAVFSAKPYHTVQWRIGRLVLAVGCTYMLATMAVVMDRVFQYQSFEECQDALDPAHHPKGEAPQFDSCVEPKRKGSVWSTSHAIPTVFFTLVYLGFWEALWRLLHRQKEADQSRLHWWVGNIPIIAFWGCGLAILVILLIAALRHLWFE